MWDGFEQVGIAAESRAMSGSRPVAGKVAKSREPAWTEIVVEPRQRRGTGRFAHLWEGLEQTDARSQVQ
jgi:hypothetical protein